MAEILLHHMVAENYYWFVQVWILYLLLLKHNLVILVELSLWLILDCTCTLVNGYVFEQFLLFTFTTRAGEGKKMEREFCFFFSVNILIKDLMDPFTGGRQNTHSQIFRLEHREMEKKGRAVGLFLLLLNTMIPTT